MDKKTAINIITNCAKDYKKNLVNKNILFIFNNNSKMDFFEAVFLPRHFLHLTGIKVTNIKSSDFYKMCLNKKLSLKNIQLSNDGTTSMKLDVLQKLMNLKSNVKMIGEYNNSKTLLVTEKLIGNIYASMGFIKPIDSNYYVPNTILKEDIRDISLKPIKNVVAIFEKEIKSDLYNLLYLNKKIDITDLKVPQDVLSKINPIIFEKENNIDLISEDNYLNKIIINEESINEIKHHNIDDDLIR